MHANQDSDGVISNLPESQSVPTRRAVWPAPAVAAPSSHIGELVGLCLDMAGPLALVASQVLYAAGPFFGAGAIRLARLLESEQDSSDLARLLTTSEDDHPSDPGVSID